MSRDGDKKTKRSLAEQLANLDIELRKSEPDPSPQRESRQQEAVRSAPPQEAPRALSDKELFEQALRSLDAAQIYQAKFEGSAAAELPPALSEEEEAACHAYEAPEGIEDDEEEARQKIQEARDAALFEQMVGSVEPIAERAKYRRSRRKVAAPIVAKPRSERRLSTPALPLDGEGLHYVPRLNGQQRALKKRYARHAIAHQTPELNVRGDILEDALRQLELFVHQAWREGAPFVRVIHGRGLRSEDEPILKPAILEWLEGPGERYLRGYIPERNQSGDYGSLILELRPRAET